MFPALDLTVVIRTALAFVKLAVPLYPPVRMVFRNPAFLFPEPQSRSHFDAVLVNGLVVVFPFSGHLAVWYLLGPFVFFVSVLVVFLGNV